MNPTVHGKQTRWMWIPRRQAPSNMDISSSPLMSSLVAAQKAETEVTLGHVLPKIFTPALASDPAGDSRWDSIEVYEEE